MTGETGFHDADGIPIYSGDLVRVKHYRHYRGRRQMWLYRMVGQLDGHPVLFEWDNLNTQKHSCCLRHVPADQIEVIAESGVQRNERGELITFNERKRVRE